MRHNRDGRKLNRTASHRKAMLKNMVTSLFARERISTTTAKAKEASRLAERMITFARRGDLAARRHVAKTVRDPQVLRKLFDEIAPRYADRPGGYTRVLKLGARRGDGAQRAMLELLRADEEGRKKKKKPRKKYHDVEIPPAPEVRAEGSEAVPDSEASGEGAEAAAPAGEAKPETQPEAEEKAAGGAKPRKGAVGKKREAAAKKTDQAKPEPPGK